VLGAPILHFDFFESDFSQALQTFLNAGEDALNLEN